MKALYVLFVLLFSACATISIPEEGSVSSFDALQFLEKGEAVIVDTRAEYEKGAGVPRGALAHQFGPDDFLSRPASEKEKAEFVKEISKLNASGKKILLLCQYGVRSESARQTLARAGIQAFSIAGGWLGRDGQAGLKDWMD